jgi:signal transduction histidine kinase/CheY-like chemotaxis protein
LNWRALKETIARQKLLSVAVNRIRCSLDLEHIFRNTAEEVQHTLNCDRVVIYRFNEDWSGNFMAEASTPGWRSLIESTEPEIEDFTHDSASQVDDSNCLVKLFSGQEQSWLKDTYLQEQQGGLYQSGIPYRAVDDIYHAGFPPCYLHLLETFQSKAYVILPIFLGDRLWGLLGIYQNDKPRHWRAEETSMLVQIASQLSIALQQSELMRELQEQKDKAEAANKAKNLFLANMSHELRTPLSSILGFSELLQHDSSLSEDQLDSIDSICQSGQHLLNLINDVLSMSQIEAGKVNLNFEFFNLRKIIKSVKDIVGLAAAQKGLNFLVDIDDNLPKLVYFDQNKLKQILINLLNNAIKFTTKGHIHLLISFDSDTFSDYGIKFEVIDTGEGMDSDELEILFQAFQQTTTGRNSKQGTGLGLAISQNFVRLMGGQIQVASQRKQGTNFWFTLPIDSTKVQVDMPHVDRPVRQFVNHLAPQDQIPKILIIEDQADQRELLNSQLQEIGFMTKVAKNGAEGISIWEEWQPDLLLLDLRMPSVDGYMVIKEIDQFLKLKNQYKRPKIIIVTADVFHQQNEQDSELDYDEVLYKPVQIDDLFNKIAQHLEIDFFET